MNNCNKCDECTGCSAGEASVLLLLLSLLFIYWCVVIRCLILSKEMASGHGISEEDKFPYIPQPEPPTLYNDLQHRALYILADFREPVCLPIVVLPWPDWHEGFYYSVITKSAYVFICTNV